MLRIKTELIVIRSAIIAAVFVSGTVWTSCRNASASSSYIDLETGKEIIIERNLTTGEAFEAATGKPVRLYVDLQTGDTVDGSTGEVVNNRIRKTLSGTWEIIPVANADVIPEHPAPEEYKDSVARPAKQPLKVTKSKQNQIRKKAAKPRYERIVEPDGDVVIKGEGYMKKIDRDGDIKIKEGNKIIKIDGKTGKRKVKYDD